MATEHGLYDLGPLKDLSKALETCRDGRLGARVQFHAKSLKQSAFDLKLLEMTDRSSCTVSA